MRRARSAAVVMSVLSVLSLAACSDASAPAAEPTLTSAPGTTAAGTSPSSTFVMPTEPATPPNRKLESQLEAEWGDRWLSCMRDSGYEPHVQADGGYQFDGPDDAVSAAVAACRKQAGPEVTYAPITPSEANHLYDLELAAKKCLEEHGVPVSDPPSREHYIETVLGQHSVGGVAVGETPWQAYSSVLGDWTPWEKLCPLPSLWSQ